jgi:transcriptional regulator with XRE-family HTH domain
MKASHRPATVVTERMKSRTKRQDASIDALLQRLEAGLASAETLVHQWRERPPGSKSETLRSLRDAAKLSQAELARRARTTQSHVAHIESGEKDPQTDMIARLAKALGVRPERVFSSIRGQRGKRTVPAKMGTKTRSKAKAAAKTGRVARKPRRGRTKTSRR